MRQFFDLMITVYRFDQDLFCQTVFFSIFNRPDTEPVEEAEPDSDEEVAAVQKEVSRLLEEEHKSSKK